MKWCLILLAGLLVLSRDARGAATGDDPREVDARAKFALADYQGAVEIFARLYAERGDPVYLRNIGRCFQMMGETHKAISSFEEYLRKGRRISDAERAEVRGFIDDLRRRAASGAAPAAPKPAPAASPAAPVAHAPKVAPAAAPKETPAPKLTPAPEVAPTPKPALAQPAPASRAALPPPVPAAAPSILAAPPQPMAAGANAAPEREGTPFYRRWWFWTGVAATAVAITVAAGAAGAFTHTQDAPCPDGRQCNP